MNTTTRRLQDLEARFLPPDLTDLSDDDRYWLSALSDTAIMLTTESFAHAFAATRFHAEGGFPEGARSGHVDGWRVVLSEEARAKRIMAELDTMERVGLEPWKDTPAREGWPVLTGPTYTLDGAGFGSLLDRHLASLTQARAAGDPRAELWRRLHPRWRPTMTRDEALAFDVDLLVVGPGRGS
jgi:hypothetical protein